MNEQVRDSVRFKQDRLGLASGKKESEPAAVAAVLSSPTESIPKSPWAATLAARASIRHTNNNNASTNSPALVSSTTAMTAINNADKKDTSSSTVTSQTPTITGTTSSTTTTTIATTTTTNPTSTSSGNAAATVTATTTNNSNNNSNDEARRRAEAVKKNWKIVLDMAMKNKRPDVDYFDRSESVALNMSGFASSPPNREIYASEKENWIYFSIIIATVVFLSILFCYLVYSFFPSFRAQNF